MGDHYLLLTPGPLSTTPSVKAVMLKDWCTWDDSYKHIVQLIRSKLLHIGRASEARYTSVLMQGSGTFGIEATIGTVIPRMANSLFWLMERMANELSKLRGYSELVTEL